MKHTQPVEEFLTRLERRGYVVVEDLYGVSYYPCRYGSAVEADEDGEFRFFTWEELEEGAADLP